MKVRKLILEICLVCLIFYGACLAKTTPDVTVQTTTEVPKAERCKYNLFYRRMVVCIHINIDLKHPQ